MNTIRYTNLIRNQGIGSIITTLDNESYIIADIDYWEKNYFSLKEDREVFKFHNARLEDLLGVDYFLKPLNVQPIKQNKNMYFIPVFRFPLWHYCPVCGEMKKLPLRGRKIPYCTSTHIHKKKIKLMPIWFVVACNNGHISDFPFDQWISHSEGCSKSAIRLKVSKNTTNITQTKVVCDECNQSRNLPNFSHPEELKCNGCRPWTGQMNEHHCESKVAIMPVHSNSLYYAKNISALLIEKKNEDKEEQFINEHYSNIKSKSSDELIKLAELMGLDKEKLIYYLESKDKTDILPEEFMILNSNKIVNESSIAVIPQQMDNRISNFFAKVNMVPFLTESVIFYGFQRLLDLKNPYICAISKEFKWLPGYENYGEGIFISISYEQLKLYFDICGMDYSSKMNLNQILMHSISHMIIKELSFVSGYQITSIREKLYISDDSSPIFMCGALIYTTSADKNGTLGGLCELAKKDKFTELVIESIKKILSCSLDPFCINNSMLLTNQKQSRDDYQNGESACHHCLYLPETSCTEFNMNLDRGLIIGVQDKIGYFNDIVELFK
ncbi:MAG: DUF1998 domain-containing protein [Prolixibacteraceae bacterium]|nr:DUF1998 domain-containing protein [Prolixibacteraceae bacterium]